MTELCERIRAVQSRAAAAAREVGRDPDALTLVAATKTQSLATIRAAIACGITCCGENRVGELSAHLDENAYDGAALHFIGHLQTNKVRQVVGRVDLLESVDSLRLLEAVEACAAGLGLRQDILLEVNIAGEASKGGVPPAELDALVAATQRCPHVRLRGLMCIPPAVPIGASNGKFFALTHQLFVDIRTKMGDNNLDINCLSMGMSGDYEDAVRFGATHVRVGTALFGERMALTR